MAEGEQKFLKPETEKGKDHEVLEAQQEGEGIYSKEFVEKLDEILGHKFNVKGKDGQEKVIILKDIIGGHLETFFSQGFSTLSAEEKAKKQREFAKDLSRGINSIPSGDPWSFYFQRIMETGKINCSESSSLFGMVLENTKEKSGIKNVEYGFLFGHIVNMITFGDDRLYFADVRNGTFEDVSDYAKIDVENNLKIYKINWPRVKTGYTIPWRHIPVAGVRDGVIGSYAENLGSAWDAARGSFDRVLKIGRTKEELGQIQKWAGEVCRQNNLSSLRQLNRLKIIKRFFNKKIDKYQQSEEFKKEMKRLEKVMDNSD